MGTPGSILPQNELEILKARVNYAWNVWEFHGRQRMNMFNYFLVITGILVNGYVAALKDKGLQGILPAICLLGFIQCVVFIMIDWRNRTILYFADGLLKQLEEKLFESDPNKPLGPMSQRAEKEKKGLFGFSKMVYWIWLTYSIIGVGFLIALIRSFCVR